MVYEHNIILSREYYGKHDNIRNSLTEKNIMFKFVEAFGYGIYSFKEYHNALSFKITYNGEYRRDDTL